MIDFRSHDGLAVADLIRRRQISPREAVMASIDRIEAENPRLNAVVHRMFDRALALAGGNIPDGPFHGVPFLLKDLLAWYEGEPITNGSCLFKGWIAPMDSEMVRRYKRAGLIVVGKTNTPEFGLVPFTESDLLGTCRNPWNPAMTAGGSSGGSAAAVASGMVPLAGGGDGGGSIRIPASCCGLFGLKPTRGRTPTGPLEGELWRGATVEHVLTHTVRDSAAMLDAVAGPDVGAPYFAPPPARPFLDEVRTPPGRLRIAFTTQPQLGRAVHADCVKAVTEAAGLLETLGHDVVEDTYDIDREAFNTAFLTVVCVETAAELDMSARLLDRPVRRTDLEVSTWALSLIGRAISGPDYSNAVRYLQLVGRQVGAFFERYAVHVSPVVAGPPFPHGALQPAVSEKTAMAILGALRASRVMKAAGALERAAESVFEWMSFTPIANATGQPAMSVPLSWNVDGLPIGVHFTGRYADEATLFRLAAELEIAAPWREKVPPDL
ncbi:MAG TPA: amidase [Gemmatimonadaceae bacterium]